MPRKKSPYAQVAVTEENGLRNLMLGSVKQSCWDPSRPDEIIFNYAKLQGVALTAWPGISSQRSPRILLVGLGGGTLCRHLYKYYPRARIDAVELDPVVHEFAVKYFDLNSRVSVTIGDGRDFLSKTRRTYDIIFLDAYGEIYIPPELVTLEFLTLARSRLSPQGMFIANTWIISPSMRHELRTYEAAFGPCIGMHYPGDHKGNRVIFAGKESLPAMTTLRRSMLKNERLLGHVREFEMKLILPQMQWIKNTSEGEILTDLNVRQFVNFSVSSV